LWKAAEIYRDQPDPSAEPRVVEMLCHFLQRGLPPLSSVLRFSGFIPDWRKSKRFVVSLLFASPSPDEESRAVCLFGLYAGRWLTFDRQGSFSSFKFLLLLGQNHKFTGAIFPVESKQYRLACTSSSEVCSLAGSTSRRIMHVKVIHAGPWRVCMDSDSNPVASVKGSSE
jgi:hypothetical protein